MLDMGTLLDLERWRRARERRPSVRDAEAAMLAPVRRLSPAPDHGVVETERLERAVDRLDRATTRVLQARGRLGPGVETQLLALIGELSVGLVSHAADRAERLADRLAPARTSGS
jgi:hypothetical protein